MTAFRLGAGARMRVRGEWFAGAREILCRRVYEMEPGLPPEAGWNVVDLGSSAGTFSVASALRGAEVVVDVEAQAHWAERARQLARLNGCSDHVVVLDGLVGGSTGLLSDPGAWAGTHPPCISGWMGLSRRPAAGTWI